MVEFKGLSVVWRDRTDLERSYFDLLAIYLEEDWVYFNKTIEVHPE
jgi:hypothetical protein